MGRVSARAGLAAIGVAATGCAGLLDIQVYDQGPDASAEGGAADSSFDAHQDASFDGPESDAADGFTFNDASAEGGAADSSFDAHQDASFDGPESDAADGPTCNASVCTEPGAVCQDAQTVATCGTDANGCLYVASTSPCTSPKSCAGTSPTAMCSLTCSNTCAPGQTSCVSGGLVTCTLGNDGCYAYGTPAACGTRQTCAGAGGSALCTCNTDPVCSSVGNSCANTSTLASCAQDAQGCFYEASSSMCMGGQTCKSGVCGCSGATPTLCGSTCTDIASDPLNCGVCGSPCPGAALGETCSGGQCQSYSIASAVSPFALATDGLNVYYLSNSTMAGVQLDSVPVGGGTGSGPFSVPGAATVATDGVDVYWGGIDSLLDNEGVIYLAAITNLADSSMVMTILDPVVVTFTYTVGNQLFFAVQCDGIFSVPLRTSGATSNGYGGNDGCIHALGADSTQVYWANSTGLVGLFAESTMGGPVTALSSATNVQGLAVGGSFVYYTDAAGGTVSSVPTNGSAAPTMIASASAPLGLVADGNYVYWINGSGTSIMKVPLAGGAVTTLATGQSATAIAQDGSSLYWTNASAIMRIPK